MCRVQERDNLLVMHLLIALPAFSLLGHYQLLIKKSSEELLLCSSPVCFADLQEREAFKRDHVLNLY